MMAVLFILDLLAFASLAWLFTIVIFNMAIDMEKTLDANFQPVDLTAEQKRARFVWFALAAVLPMLIALLHIILFFGGSRP